MTNRELSKLDFPTADAAIKKLLELAYPLLNNGATRSNPTRKFEQRRRPDGTYRIVEVA